MAESNADLSDTHQRGLDASAEPTPNPPALEPVIDFRFGEAIVIFDILTELSKHRDLPLRVCGKNLEGRPTIHVTLAKPVDDLDAVRAEYKNGRARTIKERCGCETEHFAFEWVAPR